MALSLRDINEPNPIDTSAAEIADESEYSQLAGSVSAPVKTMDGVRAENPSSTSYSGTTRTRSSGTPPATTTDVQPPVQQPMQRRFSADVTSSIISSYATKARAVRGTDWRAVALSVRNNVVQTLHHQRAQQEIAQREQAKEFEERRKHVKKPSKLLYYPLIVLAIVIDVLGLLTLTGIGAVLVWIINVIASIFFFLIGLLLGKNIKNTRVSGEGVAKIVANAEQRIVLYRKNIAAIVRFAKRTAAGRSILRKSWARKGITWASKGLKWFNGPIVKRALPLVAELIPIMNMLPWYTINTVLTYREHKKEYALSLQTLGEFPPKVQEERAAFAELHHNKLLEGAAVVKGALQRWSDMQKALSRGQSAQRASRVASKTPIQDVVSAEATS